MENYLWHSPDIAGILTKHQFDASDGPWSHWKYTVRGDPQYTVLGDRLNELVAADLLCHEEYDRGLIELAIEEGFFTEEQFDDIRDIDPIE